MGMLTIRLDLPGDLVGVLDVPEDQLETQLRELIAVELFRERRISSGKGAELLGVHKWEFIQVLARHGCDYFTESPEELQQETDTLERLHGGKGSA